MAIAAAFCLYGFYRTSGGASKPNTETPSAIKVESNGFVAPEKSDKGSAKDLHRDFVAQLDRNVVDGKGDGLKKNEELAFNTMTLLKEKRDNCTDPAERQYLDKFYQAVEKYHSQVARYNQETAQLAELTERINSETDAIRSDSSLGVEEKFARQRMLRKQLHSEFDSTSVSADDINTTLQSLRKL